MSLITNAALVIPSTFPKVTRNLVLLTSQEGQDSSEYDEAVEDGDGCEDSSDDEDDEELDPAAAAALSQLMVLDSEDRTALWMAIERYCSISERDVVDLLLGTYSRVAATMASTVAWAVAADVVEQ